MCFDHDSRPPIAPIAGGAASGDRGVVQSADGSSLSVFHAAAERPTGAGMLIFPDIRGLHPFYEELALRFAEAGIDAIAIDYFGRTAGTGARGGDFDHQPHLAHVRFEDAIADAAAAITDLRAKRDVRAMFSIGFCFGGRLAFLSATREELGLAGVIGFYGVLVGPGRGGTPAPVDLAAEVRGAVLGLFGGADQSIPASSIAEFDGALTDAGIDHDLVTYDGAPHSFFDRKAAEFADASTDAWRRVMEFVRRLTPPG
jgi:carboxymethylenebutenolidase